MTRLPSSASRRLPRRPAEAALGALLLLVCGGSAAGAGVHQCQTAQGAVFTDTPSGAACVLVLPEAATPASGRAEPWRPTLLPPPALRQAIGETAARHALPADLLLALVAVESAFRPQAVSRKGAQGLTQLMPATARELGVSRVFDPHENLDAGARHLRRLLDRMGGDVRLALAAYNAGEGAVARHRGVPPFAETMDYIRRIEMLRPAFAAVP